LLLSSSLFGCVGGEGFVSSREANPPVASRHCFVETYVERVTERQRLAAGEAPNTCVALPGCRPPALSCLSRLDRISWRVRSPVDLCLLFSDGPWDHVRGRLPSLLCHDGRRSCVMMRFFIPVLSWPRPGPVPAPSGSRLGPCGGAATAICFCARCSRMQRPRALALSDERHSSQSRLRRRP
jgi:hypothetical protein